jgi:hypothetical protein
VAAPTSAGSKEAGTLKASESGISAAVGQSGRCGGLIACASTW